jgi:hypothetical protein
MTSVHYFRFYWNNGIPKFVNNACKMNIYLIY